MIFIKIKEKADELYKWAAEKINDVYYRKLDRTYAPKIEYLTIDAVRSLIQQFPFEVELGLLGTGSVVVDVFLNNKDAALCVYTILRGEKSEKLIEEALKEAGSDPKMQTLQKYEQSRELMKYF